MDSLYSNDWRWEIRTFDVWDLLIKDVLDRNAPRMKTPPAWVFDGVKTVERPGYFSARWNTRLDDNWMTCAVLDHWLPNRTIWHLQQMRGNGYFYVVALHHQRL